MVQGTKIRSLKVPNRIDELAGIAEFLEETGDEWGLDPSVVLSINLVIEEAFTNIVSYGYDDQSDHIIEIQCKLKDKEIGIVITDDGHAWDPTLREEPDISLGPEDRPVGGLGIFLMKKMMDKVGYERNDNKNILSLTKYLEP
jgi:serine/threonine-protein kinase RsbW